MKTNKTTPDDARASRRRFTKTVTAAMIVAPFASIVKRANAQTPTPTSTPTSPAASNTSAQNPTKPSPLVEAYAGVMRVKFGEKLTDEEFARVRRDLEGNVRASETLRAAKLNNSDEPDFIFNA
ncbi:MAG: hypothetical protein NVSMB56_20880 [Pyrinomonadaceae bacterium]